MRFCRQTPCVKSRWTVSDLAERLDQDRQSPDNQRAVDAAAALVREHHSWPRRRQQIYSNLQRGGPVIST
jgi:hypothetical protein